MHTAAWSCEFDLTCGVARRVGEVYQTVMGHVESDTVVSCVWLNGLYVLIIKIKNV